MEDIELFIKEGGCGMSLHVNPNITNELFGRVAQGLVQNAIRQLGRLNRPLVFEIYLDRGKGLAGWRA